MGFNVSPVARTVPFDNSTNGFASTDTQSAIEEAKATASSGTEEFSHNIVDTNLTILVKRQMIVYQEMEIESGKELNLLGELVLIE